MQHVEKMLDMPLRPTPSPNRADMTLAFPLAVILPILTPPWYAQIKTAPYSYERT